MFADRLKQLMNVLDINNKTLADYSDLDPSSISRLHNGTRILSSKSLTVQKVITGIYNYSTENNKLNVIFDITKTKPTTNHDICILALTEWLYADHEVDITSEDTAERSSYRFNRQKAKKLFGERFNAAMGLSEMSNIALSRKAHVDPSLISRYRKGLRSPLSNPDISELLSSILYRNISDSGRIKELSHVMNSKEENIDETSFYEWLCESESLADNTISSTEKLLDAIDGSALSLPYELSEADKIFLEETVDDNNTIYRGYTGLQQAVIRFLKTAISDHSKELLLFSNQNMDWMTSDPTFMRKWALLMCKCLKSDIRIKIIHNIERSLDEMNSAIVSWIPLYMMGKIEPYYSKLSTGNLFSRTIFLNPGKSCINASLVTGTEPDGSYRYDTDPEILSDFLTQYNSMLSHSRPLVDISTTDKPLIPAGNIYIMQSSLSIFSMPKEVALQFNSSVFLKKWEQINEMSESIFEHRLYECVILSDKSDIIINRAKAECIPGENKLFYTKDAYIAHLENIIKLMNKHPGYRFISLPEMPFLNIQLTVSADYVRIVRTTEPVTMITFTHPYLCQAFINFIERMLRHYRIDRNTAISKIKHELSKIK